MLSIEEIKRLMDADAVSERKRKARVGLQYYGADHDIKRYRIFYMDAEGNIQEETMRSNIKIAHPFFTELVDQCTQYLMSGKNGFVRSDDPRLQSELDLYFNENEDFLSEMYDVITGVQVKGFEYMYAFKGSGGQTKFECADGIRVVEVAQRDAEDKKQYMIYSYDEKISKDNKTITRIQVWSDSETYFYKQENGGDIETDDEALINPRPHILYRGGDNETYIDDYGMIPFFRLDNGSRRRSDLDTIKDLIDDYDLINCGLSNNIQDTAEALYVVKGFEGDNLDELMLNIKGKKHIGVSDGGDVEIKTVDIPVEARRIKLEMDEKNIYRFGMGFNSAQVGDGNITNVVIKSRYALLDLKCNKLEIRLKQFIRKLLNIVLKEINAEKGTDYQQKDVYFAFERQIITNEQDNAQIALTTAQKQQAQVNTLLGLRDVMGAELMTQQIFDALDLDYDDYADMLPALEGAEAYEGGQA